MKKILIAFMIMTLTMAFVGCGGSDKPDADLGPGIELGDYTFYTDEWREVPDLDSKAGKCYSLTLNFVGNKEPFVLDEETDAKNLPSYGVELMAVQPIGMQNVQISQAAEDSPYEGVMEFLFLIPKDDDLPTYGTLTDTKSGKSAELDLQEVKVGEPKELSEGEQKAMKKALEMAEKRADKEKKANEDKEKNADTEE